MTQLGAHVIDLKGNELPELLSSLHDDLGEREICGTSKGSDLFFNAGQDLILL